MPSIPQEIISPIPTVNIVSGSGKFTPYAYRRIKGMITVLDTIGGNGAQNLFCFRSK